MLDVGGSNLSKQLYGLLGLEQLRLGIDEVANAAVL